MIFTIYLSKRARSSLFFNMAYDMAYGDFKDLTKRTSSDKKIA